MERLALVGGIVLAIVFGIGALIRDQVGGFHFDGSWGDSRRSAYVAPVAGKLEPQVFAARSVYIRGAAAHVQVIAEDRTDISLEIDNPGGVPMPRVDLHNGEVRIDGLLSRRIQSCDRDGGVDVEEYGIVALDRLPRIVIRAPMDLDLGFGGAVFAEIGDARSLELAAAGCGTTTIGDIAETLEIDFGGSGSVRAGASRQASLQLGGSGSIEIGPTGDDFEATLGGSGSVRVASVTGSAVIDLGGSSTAIIAGGNVTSAEINIGGSGTIEVNAPIDELEVNVGGSGEVIVRHPVRSVEANIAGSGRIIVPQEPEQSELNMVGSGRIIVRPGAPPAPAQPAPPAPPPPPGQ